MELLGLPFSPWSEKARWALDARQIPYRFVRYAPLVGELGLRRKLGRFRGRVSVPVLTTDAGEVIADSARIARWADAHGNGPALFPADRATAIDRVVEDAELGLAAGRILSLRRVLGSDDALLEMVPRSVARTTGRALAIRVAAAGIRRTLRKYAVASEPLPALTAILEGLRAAIGAANGGPLLGTFTFADIAATQILAFIEPPAFGLRVGAANRRSFTDPELRDRYADVIRWRDAIYDAYRPRSR